jgi:hypothetical protein
MNAKLTRLIAGATLALSISAQAQIDPASSTSAWTPIQYGPAVVPDYTADQQGGSSEGDIVGDANNPALYISHYNGGTPTLFTDGELAFRFRLGADKSPAGYKGVALVGMDLDANGSLDLFVGVNNSGSSSTIGLWYADDGANTSPSTTGLANTATFSYAQTALNYSWTPVTAANNPGGTSTDLDGGGNDYFLSFKVPFADLVSMASTVVPGFDESSLVCLVAATASQLNSLNQDINGVQGNANSGLGWEELGAASSSYTANGQVVMAVPEPAATAIVGFCLAALIILRRGR